MIKALQYLRGDIKATDFEKVNFLKGLTWIDAYNLSLKDLNLIAERINIPLHHLKNSLDKHEVPRIEHYKNYTLIIFKVVYENKTKTLGLILTRRILLTIHADNLNLKLDKDDFKAGLEYCVYRILADLLKEFSLALENNEDNLDGLEKGIFKNPDEKKVEQIFNLKKNLLYLRRALNSNIDLIPKISDKEYFKDLHIEIRQLIDLESTQASRLTSTLDMYMSSVSNNLNNVMKSFTVIASLLLLPMLVSGIYGMNLVLPLAKNPNGFWIILLIMLASVSLLIFYFKKKNWV